VQIIPTWSLHWITNIRDYFLCSGDAATVRDLLPGVRAVLDWYRRHTDATGLPAKLPFWNITDWCPWWPRGVVPGADSGPTTILSAQYIQGLADVAELLRQLGDAPRHAAEIDALETRLTKTRDLKQGMMQELLTGGIRLV
jgi:glycogen debranching enzyme